jgi:hypothetical protein
MVGMVSTKSITALILLLLCADSSWAAYIYNGGEPQHLGTQVQDNSSRVWVAEPFQLPFDAYATSLGAALARGMGPTNAGYSAWLYTLGTVSHVPEVPLAQTTEPLVPLNTQFTYYDCPLPSPVFLQAGTLYALVLKPTDSTFVGSVSYGIVPGTYYGQGTGDYGKTWYRLEYPLAVRIEGYFVPEPGTSSVLLVGLIGLVKRRGLRNPRRRR